MDYLHLRSWYYEGERGESSARNAYSKIQEGIKSGVKFPFSCRYQIGLVHCQAPGENHWCVGILVMRGTQGDDSLEQHNKIQEFSDACGANFYGATIDCGHATCPSVEGTLHARYPNGRYVCVETFDSTGSPQQENDYKKNEAKLPSCSNCGVQIAEGERCCHECGTKTRRFSLAGLICAVVALCMGASIKNAGDKYVGIGFFLAALLLAIRSFQPHLTFAKGLSIWFGGLFIGISYGIISKSTHINYLGFSVLILISGLILWFGFSKKKLIKSLRDGKDATRRHSSAITNLKDNTEMQHATADSNNQIVYQDAPTGGVTKCNEKIKTEEAIIIGGDPSLHYFVLNARGLSRAGLNTMCFTGLFMFGWLLASAFRMLGKKNIGWYYIIPAIMCAIAIKSSNQNIPKSELVQLISVPFIIYIIGCAHANAILSRYKSLAQARISEINLSDQLSINLVMEKGILQYKVLRDYEASVTTLLEALHMPGGDVRLLNLAGEALFGCKRYSEAKEFFSRALSSTENDILINKIKANLTKAEEKLQ